MLLNRIRESMPPPLKNAIWRAVYPITYSIRLFLRIPTGKVRVLPDFVIIGVYKGGSTSLYNYLLQHPNIFPSLAKEIHFFSNKFNKGYSWYRAHFPTILLKNIYKGIFKKRFLTGEATPHYFHNRHAANRIFQKLPDIKIIIILRNPVDRAYSQYNFEKWRSENFGFEESMKKEGFENNCIAHVNTKDNVSNFNNFNLLSGGIYVESLKVWFKLFPRKNILVLRSEEMFSDPGIVFQKALKFLNLPSIQLKNYKTHVKGRYPKMDDRIRKQLTEFFKPYNQELYKYLGEDLGWDI